MKKLLLITLAVLSSVLAWLLLAPTRVEPVAWQAPVAPPLSGPYATNDRLAGVQRLAAGIGRGPEGIAFDDQDRVITGFDDGRVIRLSADGRRYEVLGSTGGRPLGLVRQRDGTLLIADARHGLVRLAADGSVSVVSVDAGGVAVGFADDVDAAGGVAYYSDASTRFSDPHFMHDVLEHRPNGRLIAWDAASGQSTVVAGDLYFANGVALGPDGDSLFVAESAAYRVMRIWLRGPKAGRREVFVDNLPGFPDNVSWNGAGRVWVAIASPRNALLDALAGSPRIRKMIARLPEAIHHALAFKPIKHAFALGFDLDGRLVANLQHVAREAYAPVTSVEERGPWLYFGSLTQPSIARLPLAAAIDGVPPPPAGWQDVPSEPQRVTP